MILNVEKPYAEQPHAVMGAEPLSSLLFNDKAFGERQFKRSCSGRKEDAFIPTVRSFITARQNQANSSSAFGFKMPVILENGNGGAIFIYVM